MTSQPALFSASDRLGLMLFLATLAHLVVILGVTFSSPPQTPALAGLDVTLVQTASPDAPRTDYRLAQTNSDGGGRSRQQVSLQSPFPLQTLSRERQSLPTATLSVTPLIPDRRARLLTGNDQAIVPSARSDPEPSLPRQQPQPGVVNISALERERAQLSAEISRSWQQYEHHPREIFISARTRAYAYARYMAAWKTRVERVGNTHYPEAAKAAHLSGRLVLDVAINADGSLYAVRILQSSGSPILDRAAIRIVHQAAPFAPFAGNLRRSTDVLHITRTWEFRASHMTTGTTGSSLAGVPNAP